MGESDLYSGILLPKIIGLFPSLMRVCVMQAWRPEETGGGHTHREDWKDRPTEYEVHRAIAKQNETAHNTFV